MMDKGFLKVRPLEGGIEAWIAAGHETTAPEPNGTGERSSTTHAREKENA
jgi:3-mercaptopyruvate sulfurtransferase SseA